MLQMQILLQLQNNMDASWPLYFKDRLIVGNLESSVGVATLWMPKESVASVLDPSSYAVCGQLYTKRGINPLLRNILANPKIRHIVLCGVDRQGSGEALLKFFSNGIVADEKVAGELRGYKIIDDTEALIDKEISLDALELIRKNVQIYDYRMKPLDEVASFTKSLEDLDPFSDPQIFETAQSEEIDKFPSDISVFKIRRETISDAWIDVLKTVMKFGTNVPGMYGIVKEVHNLSVVVEKEDSFSPVIPDFMSFSNEGLELYIKGFLEKDKGEEPYTYGERIFDWDNIDQEALIVEKLLRFPFDRGAMAVLWKPHIDNFPPDKSKIASGGQTKGWKVPCLVMILGQCVEEDFHMTAVFRNNDMYGAWPLNCFALRRFQQNIAKKINKNLGSLTTISHIAEIYDIDFDMAQKTITENDNMARTCQWDPRGYYTIEVVNEDIVATFFSPDGATELYKITENGKKPKIGRDICHTVIKEMLISDLGAMADFGRQIAKAENAIKLGLKFEQDQPLKFLS